MYQQFKSKVASFTAPQREYPNNIETNEYFGKTHIMSPDTI